MLAELFLEVPNRGADREAPFDLDAEETLEAGAVEDLELDFFFTEPIIILQDEHLEHEHGVEWWTTSLIRDQRRGKLLKQQAEGFEIDGFNELIQWGKISPHDSNPNMI